MLDFFRDIILDISGIDSEKIKQNRAYKKADRKKYIVSRSTKGIIYFLGILYIFMGGLSIFYTSQNVFAKVKFFLLAAIDLAALILISSNKKKAEIIALILIAIFVIIMYTTTMLLY